VSVRIVLHPVLPKDAGKRQEIWGDLWHLEVRCIDLANAEKAAIDALQGVAFEDDKQIVRMLLERGQPVPEGAVFVEWAPFEGVFT
ncbi:RusA family crossover junction endodeoxyribonuclease, partial [Acidithiobacillus caldus]